MAKKITLINNKKDRDPREYVDSLPATIRSDAEQLLRLFTKVTKAPPRMWGNSMVGFGEYEYKRSNGDYGSYFATGFAMRKSGPTIYIMPGYTNYGDILKDLGPHKLGKSCVYLKNLEDINLKILEKLITAGINDLKKKYPVTMQ